MNTAERGAEHALYLEEVEKEFQALPGDMVILLSAGDGHAQGDSAQP